MRQPGASCCHNCQFSDEQELSDSQMILGIDGAPNGPIAETIRSIGRSQTLPFSYGYD